MFAQYVYDGIAAVSVLSVVLVVGYFVLAYPLHKTGVYDPTLTKERGVEVYFTPHWFGIAGSRLIWAGAFLVLVLAAIGYTLRAIGVIPL